MHQTFYIDIDEEITSIIERLKKSRTKEIVVVVPKRALLIQSIVNLRILKKETDEMGLQLMIVTQDKLGKILVEKVGIFVQQKIDNLDDNEIDLENDEDNTKEILRDETIDFNIKDRLNKIGSSDYFDEDKMKKEARDRSEKIKKITTIKKNSEISEREKLINKELVVGVGEDMKKKQPSMDISLLNKKEKSFSIGKNQENFSNIDLRKDLSQNFSDEGEFLPNFDDGFQDEKVNNFFRQQDDYLRREKKQDYNAATDLKLSSNARNLFWFFGFIVFIVVFIIGAYLFLPKATLKIISKTELEKIDLEIKGDTKITSLDYEGRVIPAKVVSLSEELSKDFKSTGNKGVSNQKARGKIIIYNEYSASPQPLVATTRFLSEGGKLFRLIKGVTVPGMTKAGEEMKPGKIEAEVMADESGDAFNIESSKFTIPGFKGSGNEKFAKFYAISSEKMTGGGSGVSDNKANSILENDITLAKNEIILDFDKVIKQKLEKEAGDDAVILEDTIKKEEAVYKLSNSIGDVVDYFKVSIQNKASVMVVAKKDINAIAESEIKKENGNDDSVDENSITYDFGKSDANFDLGTVNIKFHASGKKIPKIDLDVIKKEILGKNEKDLKAYLATFSDIKEVELSYWPSFMNSRIPFQKSRVNVILDKQ